MSETLARVQALVAHGEVRISDHGYEEFSNDDIFVDDVLIGVSGAALVEDYPDDTRGPSVLVLQRDPDGRPVHVVWAIPRGRSTPAVVVTAYRPDPSRWSSDFMRRVK